MSISTAAWIARDIYLPGEVQRIARVDGHDVNLIGIADRDQAHLGFEQPVLRSQLLMFAAGLNGQTAPDEGRQQQQDVEGSEHCAPISDSFPAACRDRACRRELAAPASGWPENR